VTEGVTLEEIQEFRRLADANLTGHENPYGHTAALDLEAEPFPEVSTAIVIVVVLRRPTLRRIRALGRPLGVEPAQDASEGLNVAQGSGHDGSEETLKFEGDRSHQEDREGDSASLRMIPTNLSGSEARLLELLELLGRAVRLMGAVSRFDRRARLLRDRRDP
jgi:hypothetical protein